MILKIPMSGAATFCFSFNKKDNGIADPNKTSNAPNKITPPSSKAMATDEFAVKSIPSSISNT